MNSVYRYAELNTGKDREGVFGAKIYGGLVKFGFAIAGIIKQEAIYGP